MGRAVPHDDRIRHADPLQRRALKGLDVDFIVLGEQVKIEVYERGRDILDRSESLVEVPCRQKPPQQILRDRLAGPRVDCVSPQDLGLFEPVLEELDGNSTKSRATFVPASIGNRTSDSSPCKAWPNS
jgi:hypothetical protein